MSLLFVYGTLKRGGSNHAHLAGQKFIGTAQTVPGFRLFELEGFPGMVPLADDLNGVTGEVWSVDDQALAALDDFEGVNEALYQRARVALLAPFDHDRVETYLYLRSVEGRRDLGSAWR